MRINSSKPPIIAPPKPREKSAVESSGKAAEDSAAARAGDAAEPSVDRTARKADSASARLDDAIAARLADVSQQLRSGTYVVDYERLARRVAEEGLVS